MWEARKRKLGGYSGGMKQRFGIAVALIGNPKLIIVDEPTAGLDPAERVRLLNLLSELGENSAVILSTHIVEDVSELCTRMAIINQGQILMESQPMKAINDIRGKIWSKNISKDDYLNMASSFDVISTKLLGGKTYVHVYSAEQMPSGFERIQPDLEDVYFCAMKGLIGRSLSVKEDLL